jgi:hypothetical protein
MLELSRKCTEYGGYTVSSTGQIKGLIYAPFVTFIREEFSIDAEVVIGITADDIPRVLQEAEFFIASVHHSIRWPDREPPSTGGHLVLVLEAADDIVFHNPSGMMWARRNMRPFQCRPSANSLLVAASLSKRGASGQKVTLTRVTITLAVD